MNSLWGWLQVTALALASAGVAGAVAQKTLELTPDVRLALLVEFVGHALIDLGMLLRSSCNFYRRDFGIAAMAEKCLKCRTLTPTAIGRPPSYCSTGCRAAEHELRRLQRHLERPERQRETPLQADLAERAIDELEARLRTLLADEDRAIHNRYR
jgi:hypothetical protein